MEAVQRVLELEAAVDQLRLEKTDLSYRLKQELQRNGRAPDAGGPATSDTGSEVRLAIEQLSKRATTHWSLAYVARIDYLAKSFEHR